MPQTDAAQDPRPAQARRRDHQPDEVLRRGFQGRVLPALRDQGWAEPLWLETTAEDTGVGQAREALKAGVDVVIAAGGDGTVRCVAEVLAGTGTPMGLVPLGTGNLLARNVGVDITDPVGARVTTS